MSNGARDGKGLIDPLRRFEQLAVAEELISSLRHDLRNRFATVRNAIYYVKRRIGPSEVFAADPRLAQFVNTIDEEMVASDVALAEGRVWARIEGDATPRARVRDCVEQAIGLSRIANPAIRIDASLGPGEVDIAPGVLAVAVRCLIENAAEAMPGGGVVAVHTAAADASQVFIRVADEGPGIPASTEDAVVEPFFTTKPGHLGLGLAIASRAARRAGGKLALHNRPAGLVVTLSLPSASPAASQPRPDAER